MSTYLNMPDGQMVPVRDGLVIGRVAGCDIVIDDSKASRRHARFCVEGGVVEIEDLDSSNGTLLNGKPVQRRMLRDGDEVRIGATVMVFRASAPQARSKVEVGDDVDLFGDDESEVLAAGPSAAVPSAAMPSAAVPSPAPVETPRREVSPPAQVPVPVSAPPPPPRADVIEFADEVVEVRKPARPAPATKAGGGVSSGVGLGSLGDVALQQKQRTLQFSKHSDRGGALGDDLAQMSGGMRLLVYALVLAGAGGVAWALMNFLS